MTLHQYHSKLSASGENVHWPQYELSHWENLGFQQSRLAACLAIIFVIFIFTTNQSPVSYWLIVDQWMGHLLWLLFHSKMALHSTSFSPIVLKEFHTDLFDSCSDLFMFLVSEVITLLPSYGKHHVKCSTRVSQQCRTASARGGIAMLLAELC